MSTDPVPRLQLLAFAYELTGGDLLAGAGDTWRRVTSADGSDPVSVTFDDASTEDLPGHSLVTIYRDQSAMPPEYAGVPPAIVA